MFLVLLILSTISAATETNQAYEAGIYRLKSVDGLGRGKYLAFRSSHTKILTRSPLQLKCMSAFGTTVSGLVCSVVLGVSILAGMGITVAGAVVAMGLTVSIRSLLRSDALVMSSTRKLEFILESSDKAPNGFTLKTRITRRDPHGGNFVNMMNSKQKRVHLEEEERLTFVATRANQQNPNHVYLQTVDDSETPKWLTARLKKVKLDSTSKSAWVLAKLSDASSSFATDGTSIDSIDLIED